MISFLEGGNGFWRPLSWACELKIEEIIDYFLNYKQQIINDLNYIVYVIYSFLPIVVTLTDSW